MCVCPHNGYLQMADKFRRYKKPIEFDQQTNGIHFHTREIGRLRQTTIRSKEWCKVTLQSKRLTSSWSFMVITRCGEIPPTLFNVGCMPSHVCESHDHTIYTNHTLYNGTWCLHISAAAVRQRGGVVQRRVHHSATQLKRTKREKQQQRSPYIARRDDPQSLCAELRILSAYLRSVEVHGQALVFCYGNHV